MPHQAKVTKAYPSVPTDLEQLVEVVGGEALQRALSPRDSWPQFYREQAMALGYVMPSGDVASAALAREMANAFGVTFLDKHGAKFSKTATASWPALLVRPDTATNVSATRHVLMNAFLRLGVRAQQEVFQSYCRPGPIPTIRSEMDEQATKRFEELQKEWKKVRSRHTVREVLFELGLSQTYRHHYLEFPKLRAALKKFRYTDLAERQIGRRKRIYGGVNKST